MDYRLTPEQETLKQEFIDFFEEEKKSAPPDLAGGMEARFESDEAFAYFQYMAKRQGEMGYHAMAWPKEYGGREATLMEQGGPSRRAVIDAQHDAIQWSASGFPARSAFRNLLRG